MKVGARIGQMRDRSMFRTAPGMSGAVPVTLVMLAIATASTGPRRMARLGTMISPTPKPENP